MPTRNRPNRTHQQRRQPVRRDTSPRTATPAAEASRVSTFAAPRISPPATERPAAATGRFAVPSRATADLSSQHKQPVRGTSVPTGPLGAGLTTKAAPTNAAPRPFAARPAGMTASGPALYDAAQPNRTGIPKPLLGQMEGAFETDFSTVEVVRDSHRAAALGTKAFAQGEQLHFAPGQFKPTHPQGRELLGHELAHVVQQREGRVRSTERGPGGDRLNREPALERQANQQGRRAGEGRAPGSGRRPRRVVGLSAAGPMAAPPPAAFARLIQGFDIAVIPNNFNPAHGHLYDYTGKDKTGSPVGGNRAFTTAQRDDILTAGENQAPMPAGMVPATVAGPWSDESGDRLLKRADASMVSPEVDHIIPKGMLGANDDRNARILSRDENTNAGTSRPAGNERRVVLYENLTIKAGGNTNNIAAGTTLTLAEVGQLHRYLGLPAPGSYAAMTTPRLWTIFKAPITGQKKHNIRIS